jgi:hypothetical protein
VAEKIVKNINPRLVLCHPKNHSQAQNGPPQLGRQLRVDEPAMRFCHLKVRRNS